MQFPNEIKFHIRTKFKLSSLCCMCFEAGMDEQVFCAKFILPIVYTVVMVVLHEGIYRKIAGSTTLCRLIKSTSSQWSICKSGV